MQTMASTMAPSSSSSLALSRRVNNRTKAVRVSSRGSRQVVRAEYETQLVITAANAACLALGRWAFLPLQRASAEKAGLPAQNDQTYEAAGDERAKEAAFVMSTNDPAGFTLIDTLMWGSVGHALGFIILATNASLRVG